MKKFIYLLPTLSLFLALIFITNCAYATENTTPEEKTVYLTFDDGPTPKITEELLDILKENDVKATFFIVGKEIKGREAILKRIYEEGHGIGLHTYSHDFKKIYQSADAFIDEMDQDLNAINEALGTSLDIKAIRFPGGSAGRLTKQWLEALNQKGYQIYDWNVDLEDGIKGNLAPSEFVRNAKKFRDKSPRKIILAHCNSNNKNTCCALPEIIKYYKEQGYTFKIIDNTTPPYYYRIKQ
nr:polysaccharide deacetylase family protein [uncultured Cellulosilyticum sp.]